MDETPSVREPDADVTSPSEHANTAVVTMSPIVEDAEPIYPDWDTVVGGGRLGGGRLRPMVGSKSWHLAKHSWWFPWLLGVAVIAVGVATVLPLLNETTPSGTAGRLPTSTHTVLYEVTGTGASPNIRYVTDGIAASDTVRDVSLPWRRQFTLTVGPGLGIAQLVATNNGTANSISCSVSVDGVVVYHATAPGPDIAVGCSAVIRP